MGLERKVRVGGRSMLMGEGTKGAVYKYEDIVDMMRLSMTENHRIKLQPASLSDNRRCSYCNPNPELPGKHPGHGNL